MIFSKFEILADGGISIARTSALIDLTADEEIVSSSGTATGQRQQQESNYYALFQI